MGFAKGFGIKEIKELTLPISRPLAILWLAAALLIITFGILYLLSHKYTWLPGFIAVLLSQVLIILVWKDAKFGTLANLLILFVSIAACGDFFFTRQIGHETKEMLSRSGQPGMELVTADDIKSVPPPVQKWLSRSGIIGKPFISSGKLIQKAELKMSPDQDKWLNASAIQYTFSREPAFIWAVDVKMNKFLHFRGRDKFENGKGEMLIKMNSLLSVVDEKGEKMDEGTLQRYLGEIVWFPSMALSQDITWEEIDDSTAVATMEYLGTMGSGTFNFNQDGDFTSFSALRYKGNEADAGRFEWIISVEEYKTFEGIRVPSKMTATWKLEDKDWTWLKLEVSDITYNEGTNQ